MKSGYAVLALAVLCALTAPSGNAVAHGAVDQALQAQAGCNPLNFPASITGAGGQRQEFVPSQPGLVAVDVCISAESGPTEVDVVIKTAGGTTVGGGSVVADLPAYEHVDFAATIPVQLGATYVIELSTSSLNVTWYGNPPDVNVYSPGSSNAPGTVSDFAFITYSGALPPTATGTAAKSATATRTRTPSPTRTPVSTITPAPTDTPAVASLASATPGMTTPVAASTTAPATGTTPSGARRATPTRVSGVLGGARRIGTIKPPDVGSGPTRATPPAEILGVAACGAALLLLGLARCQRNRQAPRRC
jgi:hypothetical protein